MGWARLRLRISGGRFIGLLCEVELLAAPAGNGDLIKFESMFKSGCWGADIWEKKFIVGVKDGGGIYDGSTFYFFREKMMSFKVWNIAILALFCMNVFSYVDKNDNLKTILEQGYCVFKIDADIVFFAGESEGVLAYKNRKYHKYNKELMIKSTTTAIETEVIRGPIKLKVDKFHWVYPYSGISRSTGLISNRVDLSYIRFPSFQYWDSKFSGVELTVYELEALLKRPSNRYRKDWGSVKCYSDY